MSTLLGRLPAPCTSAAAASTSGRGSSGEHSWQVRRGILRPPQPLLQPRSRQQPGALLRRRVALPVTAGGLTPKKGLSLKQRVRAARAVLHDQWRALGAALSALPPVAALLQAAALLNAKLQPLYAFFALVEEKFEALIESYNNFLAEETKRRWNWENKHQAEIEFWKGVPPYMGFVIATLVYEAFVPVSLLVAVLIPLFYAGALWETWYTSPVFLGLLLIAPVKFVPWAEFCLVWPGLL